MTSPERSGNGSSPTRRPLVTIIAPAYNEAGNAAGLVDFFRQIRSRRPEFDFELVVVDDGSTDDTSRLVQEALADDDVARVATFSRNFGSHAAITAGLALSRGDCAITIGTDLQEPIEMVDQFLDAWQDGNELVWSVRETRNVPKGKGFANWLARVFNAVFYRFANLPNLPKEGPAQVLLSRKVIDVLNAMPERNRNIFGMFAWVGFKQTTIYFHQKPRASGKSKWTTAKKIRLVMDSFVQFSTAPFLATMLLGVLLALLGLGGGLAALIVALATLSAPVGWLLVLCSVFFVGGLQLAALGGFGEYVWRAGDDARRRPLYILSGVHDHGAPASAPMTTRSEVGVEA
ncbi:MAG TPA: glycosyltransferase family 2 protein [Actinophytocola sp.]|uniref:glycosyltransferase family 2 protein n=1 Tax=Actinophytocola sp. TaxID=1872138 RepID=UPI002DDD93C0|nr:glycosyltransferase family 2 protein [Actinophytocola sp.]HEV2777952.1 glycosyltransferase family 2 protein [Actinophytocola sp.]